LMSSRNVGCILPVPAKLSIRKTVKIKENLHFFVRLPYFYSF